MEGLRASIWSGRLTRQNGDPARCRAAVADGGRSPTFHQCNRKPAVFRECEEPRGTFGFCRLHDPVAVAEKAAERDVQWRRECAEREAREAARKAKLLATERCIATLREIEAGRNDPISAAREALIALDTASGIEAPEGGETTQIGSTEGESSTAEGGDSASPKDIAQ